jgi:hypothetical protein
MKTMRKAAAARRYASGIESKRAIDEWSTRKDGPAADAVDVAGGRAVAVGGSVGRAPVGAGSGNGVAGSAAGAFWVGETGDGAAAHAASSPAPIVPIATARLLPVVDRRAGKLIVR